MSPGLREGPVIDSFLTIAHSITGLLKTRKMNFQEHFVAIINNILLILSTVMKTGSGRSNFNKFHYYTWRGFGKDTKKKKKKKIEVGFILQMKI